jgi:fructoselysine 3-epimerase
MKIGIASGVYLNYPFIETMKRVAAAGYDGIDAWSGRPHIYRSDFSANELRQLRQLVEDEGMIVSSFLSAFYRYPYSLSSPNDIIRQDSIQYMKECVDNAVLLGAPIVLLVPEKTIYGQSIEDAWQRLAASIDAICRYSRQYELMLGLEAVNHTVSDMVNTAADAWRMIEQLAHDNLGVVLDTGHMNLAAETSKQAVDLLGNKLLQVHVNDNDGQHQQNLIPGEGTFNFGELMDVLYQSGFDGFLTAELSYHYTFDPDPAVQLTAKKMRQMLKS